MIFEYDDKVAIALRWLKRNNKWYRDVSVLEDRLSQLPLDDNLEHLFVREVADLDLPEQPEPINQQNNANVDSELGISTNN